MSNLSNRRHAERLATDTITWINLEALAELPVDIVKEALDQTGRRIGQDGYGNFFMIKREAA